MNDLGASGERSLVGSGGPELGSISSGLSFFTLPTAVSTFHVVIFVRVKRPQEVYRRSAKTSDNYLLD
jgi:hypothetical protein